MTENGDKCQWSLDSLGTSKPRLTIYITEELRNDLSNWAEDEKRTVTNLVAYLLDRAVRERKQSQEKPKND